MDSNHRRLRRQIYSLLPLAAREPHLYSWREELNPQHADYKSAALPIELRQQLRFVIDIVPNTTVNQFFLK